MFYICFFVDGKGYCNSSTALKIGNICFSPLNSLTLEKNHEDGIILRFSYNFSKVESLQGKRINIFYYSKNYGTVNEKKFFIHKIIKTTSYILLNCISLKNLLTLNKAQLFSLNCRANFGDAHCGVDIKKYSICGTVKKYNIALNELQDDDLKVENEASFSQGKLKINNLIFVVLFVKNGVIKIINEMKIPIEEGGSYTLIQGCDKSLETCQKKYKNSKNFRGEPFVFKRQSGSIF